MHVIACLLKQGVVRVGGVVQADWRRGVW
jgi:hypothetical protein